MGDNEEVTDCPKDGKSPSSYNTTTQFKISKTAWAHVASAIIGNQDPQSSSQPRKTALPYRDVLHFHIDTKLKQ